MTESSIPLTSDGKPKMRMVTCAWEGCTMSWLSRSTSAINYCPEHRERRRKDYIQVYGKTRGRELRSYRQPRPPCLQCGDYIPVGRSKFCSDECHRRYKRERARCEPCGYAICAPGWFWKER